MKFIKNNLLLIIVDASASTEAFVGTMCLIAVRRSVSGRTDYRAGLRHRPTRPRPRAPRFYGPRAVWLIFPHGWAYSIV